MALKDGSRKMNRENSISKLQIAIYGFNLAAVCFIASLLRNSMLYLVDMMQAEKFLSLIGKRPWRPDTILIVAVCAYLLIVFFSCIGQICQTGNRRNRYLIFAAEIAFCIIATFAMNMNYNGLVLLVVADLIRGQKGSRRKVVLGVAILVLYTILDFNLVGNYFSMIGIDSFLIGYSAGTQALFRGIISLLRSVNLILFILYLTMLIQGEYQEKERIQVLYAQLSEANQKLKEYAAEAEKNAETRERNRLAREIHDTLGHALTGIVAGIDACLLTIDISTDMTKAQLEKIGNVARQGITDVRRSVNKLRPDALEKMDLENAIAKMVEDMKATAGVDVEFYNEVHPLKFHEDEEEVIYRIIQESTTNAIRHGHADHIQIAVTKVNEWLTIAVKDNGIGCKSIKEGFGLKHMQERLSLLNGQLEYNGDDGFLIYAQIPIRWGEEFQKQ
jgi:signal transduction histidine kinase